MLRPYSERFTPDLMGHKGFIKFAMKHGVPIYVIACPMADVAMPLYSNPVSDFLRKFRIGLPVFQGPYGWPGLPIPRKVELIHAISKRLDFGCHANPSPAQLVNAYEKVQKMMQTMMDEASNAYIEGS